MRVLIAAAFWVAFLIPAEAYTVKYDRGGKINTYLHRADLLNHVRIDGHCYSSCTLYLRSKNVCATHRAVLGFHAARLNGKRFRGFEKIFIQLYPRRIQGFLKRKKALSKQRFTYLKPPNLYRYVKRC